jgi:hypothetical protein
MLTSADATRYAALAAELRAFAAGLPAPLPERSLPFLDALLAEPFAQIAALLPTWLCDLIPLPDAVATRLGAAQLAGWWFAAARDALLDDQASPELSLGAGLALLRAVELYRALGLPATPAWPVLAALEARAAAAYARERASQFGNGPITAAHLAPWDDTLIADRAAGLQFAALAQLELAGVAPDDARRTALRFALERLVVARQRGDDAGDWPDDLRAGRLNSAVAARARLAARAMVAVDQLAAWLATDEAFWCAWWDEHAACCRAGRAALEPLGPSRLATLLEVEATRGALAAQAQAGWRAQARALVQPTGRREDKKTKQQQSNNASRVALPPDLHA